MKRKGVGQWQGGVWGAASCLNSLRTERSEKGAWARSQGTSALLRQETKNTSRQGRGASGSGTEIETVWGLEGQALGNKWRSQHLALELASQNAKLGSYAFL